jgi:hypothetical protein
VPENIISSTGMEKLSEDLPNEKVNSNIPSEEIKKELLNEQVTDDVPTEQVNRELFDYKAADDLFNQKFFLPDVTKYNVEELDEGKLMILTPKNNEDHECTLIWLQGFGKKTSGVRDMFEDEQILNIPENCRIVIPTAPKKLY